MFVSAVALLVAGCVAKDGPTTSAVRAGALETVKSAATVGYMLVDLNPAGMAAANDGTLSSILRFSGLSLSAGPDVSIGVGDILSITIFESEAGGLFIPKEAGSRAGNFVAIPNQQVDSTGNVIVPYVDGPIRAAGRTTRAVSNEIARRLKNRAVEPQAVVSVLEHRANDVSIIGEVNNALQFSIDPGGVRLLNAVARAGGPKFPDYETTVTLQRDGVVHRAWLSSIVKDPAQNVALRPRDVVYLSREQKVFLAMGATPSPGSVGGLNNRRFSFENDTMTLSEAVAKAGGLDSFRADAKEVYLYRLEPKSTLIRSGLDVSRFPGAYVPVVYHSDMSKGGAFFLASSFLIRDKDILFVTEDPSVEFAKFMSTVQSLTGNAVDVSGTAVNVQSVRR